MVKPLLDYARSIKSKEEQFEALQNTIRTQEASLVSLRETISQKDFQLKQQVELSSSYKKNIEFRGNQVHFKDLLIAELLAKMNDKDEELKSLRTQHKDNELIIDNTKQLDLKLSVCKAMSIVSICQGKREGVYAIRVPDMEPFSVYCDTQSAGCGWIVIQRRINGTLSFNRSWQEYKNGFGDPQGEHFLGLEKIHLLTHSQPHELYIYMVDFEGDGSYAHYSNFAIGNESEAYAIKMIGDFTGNTVDSLKHHIGIKFSTPDMDNDFNDGNCGTSFEAGWWFIDCGYW